MSKLVKQFSLLSLIRYSFVGKLAVVLAGGEAFYVYQNVICKSSKFFQDIANSDKAGLSRLHCTRQSTSYC
jgi:hypothetical protein